MFRQEENIREIEVTYKSLLYSCGIYAILKIFFVSIDKSVTKFIINHLLWACLVVGLLSVLWGIGLYLIKTYDLLYKLLSFFKLTGKIIPPNIYAALFDPNYNPKAKKGLWLTFEMGGIQIEGFVAYTHLVEGERKIFLKEIREFNLNGNLLVQRPESYGLLLDVTELKGIELVFAD